MYGMFKMNTRFIQPGRVNKEVSEAEKKEAETNKRFRFHTTCNQSAIDSNTLILLIDRESQ